MDPTTIDPGFDRWVWLGAAIFIVLLGLRAWRVETAGAPASRGSRAGRTSRGRAARVLTVLTVVAGLSLGGLLYKQGGEQLFQALKSANQNIPADPQAPAANLDPGGGGAPAAPAAPPAAGN
jgi:hypothetical protein